MISDPRHEVDALDIADLPEIATQVVERARVTSGVAIDLISTPVVVRANRVEVWRALVNLVENACRAAGPGGAVLVNVSTSAEGARLDVHDSGPRWEQGQSGNDAHGLSTVRASAAAYGGHLETGTGDLGGAVASLLLPSVRTPERATG